MTAERVWRDMIDSDLCIALLTCGHWTQPSQPYETIYFCEVCNVRRNVAMSKGDHIPAVIQSWMYVND